MHDISIQFYRLLQGSSVVRWIGEEEKENFLQPILKKIFLSLYHPRESGERDYFLRFLYYLKNVVGPYSRESHTFFLQNISKILPVCPVRCVCCHYHSHCVILCSSVGRVQGKEKPRQFD